MMASKRRETRKKQVGAVVGGAEEKRKEQVLEGLKGSFTEFRQENRPRERIPDRLRDATLEAIDGGIPEVEVIRACRISRESLVRWREVKKGIRRRVRGNGSKARVYPVVEEKLPVTVHSGSDQEETSQLQLRIGSWCISIRQNG